LQNENWKLKSGGQRAAGRDQRSEISAATEKVVALKSVVRLNKEEPGTLYLELRIWWFVL
jgi:hypothetical protein